jgi:hypothetical protein
MKKRSLTKIFLISLLPTANIYLFVFYVMLFRIIIGKFFKLIGFSFIPSLYLVFWSYLSFFYYFYWLCATRNELVDKGFAVPPAWPIFISLLLALASYVTGWHFHLLAWLYSFCLVLFFLSSLFLVVYYLYFLHNYVQAYYKLGILKKSSFNYFLLILLLPFVGQFVFQYSINEYEN